MQNFVNNNDSSWKGETFVEVKRPSHLREWDRRGKFSICAVLHALKRFDVVLPVTWRGIFSGSAALAHRWRAAAESRLPNAYCLYFTRDRYSLVKISPEDSKMYRHNQVAHRHWQADLQSFLQ